jgi:hypothetical protein
LLDEAFSGNRDSWNEFVNALQDSYGSSENIGIIDEF